MKVLAAAVVGLTLLASLPAHAQTPAPARPPQSAPGKPPAPPAAKPDPRAMLRALEDGFTAVADRVTPAVVNVSTVAQKGATNGEDEKYREFFGDDLYDRYFRRRPREDGRASGSGVIVDPKGYILTNNHVIENAREITVRLSDSRKFPATLVGRDPKTDLAVLKVDAPGPLPAAELADSDRLRVGQWAIAIGNPFGLDRTVTVGIISATARNRVGVATYENFIQTDASINPGNSGGPLLNLDGKVIGINTAIVAAGQGIGFSIPINEAKTVMRQLISQGRVVRGWLGVVIQDVTDELASSFGVREREGVLVADVMKGGPAETAGLRTGDVVVQLDGTRIREVPDLQRRVANVAPGQKIRLVVVRDRTSLPVTVTVGEMPAEEPTLAAQPPGGEGYGLQVEGLSPAAAERLNLPVSQGVIVIDVASGGPADRAGLRRGDVILEVARQPVADAPSLARALAAVPAGETALLYVHRPGAGGRNQYLVLERGPRP
ncbi:MAG TPA: DegQ family serine endoprotease [Methylomirabilota bacterium]|jgi:Do/DeqQ family serine protease|nr:DegQ family serine endoprotease [Methylomirabilota bacterium]